MPTERNKLKHGLCSGWYENRQFAVIEVPYAEDMDFIQELFAIRGIHYDYRALSGTGNNVLIIFKDNMDKTKADFISITGVERIEPAN